MNKDFDKVGKDGPTPIPLQDETQRGKWNEEVVDGKVKKMFA